MSDLVEFLRAQIAKDEQTALAASGPKAKFRIWDVDPWYGGEVKSALLRARILGSITSHPIDAVQAEHAARHDPQRALADVAAKRRILDEHASEDGTCRTCTTQDREVLWDSDTETVQWARQPVSYPCLTVRLLAEVYAGEPGYKEEWRP